MKKFAVLAFVAVLSFGFTGCSISSKSSCVLHQNLQRTAKAVVFGKEVREKLDVSGNAVDPGRPEYFIDLCWNDKVGGFVGTASVEVDKVTYEVVELLSEVELSGVLGMKEENRITVYYVWAHKPSMRAYEVRYSYDEK